jgi:hypothetical protein
MLSSQYFKKILFNMHRFLNHCWYFYVTNTFTFCFFLKKQFNPWHSAGQWSTKNLKHVEKILFPHIKKKCESKQCFFFFLLLSLFLQYCIDWNLELIIYFNLFFFYGYWGLKNSLGIKLMLNFKNNNLILLFEKDWKWENLNQ